MKGIEEETEEVKGGEAKGMKRKEMTGKGRRRTRKGRKEKGME